MSRRDTGSGGAKIQEGSFPRRGTGRGKALVFLKIEQEVSGGEAKVSGG